MALSSESFERLMNWLHPDREVAGQEYRRIHALLIKHFQSHGYADANDLADATMDRGAEKLTPEKIQNWGGEDKARYFYRVAFYMLREKRKVRLPETPLPDGVDFTRPEGEDLEPASLCLEECLQKLSPAERELIERYYRWDKGMKKESRARLAAGLNIDLSRLRVRAHRLRERLKKCLEKCLREAEK